MPKFNIPVTHMPVGAPTPGVRIRIPQTAGGRSGVGRLQKVGMNPGSGYDSSGINPSAGRPRLGNPIAAPLAPPKILERPIGGVRKK